jgi:hypothetical protein
VTEAGLPPRALALLCQACRSALPAASGDVAFRCPRCGRGWEIEGGELVSRGSAHVTAPRTRDGELLHLPYWSFAVAVRAGSREREPAPTAETLGARDLAAGIRRVFVAAYAVHRPGYLGEWALTYTREPPDWEVRQGGGPEAPGASIASGDARAIAEAYVLSEIDRATDLSKLDLDLQVGAPELWAIPCLDLGRRLRCPWTRAELPAAALDDLAEIRGDDERREA